MCKWYGIMRNSFFSAKAEHLSRYRQFSRWLRPVQSKVTQKPSKISASDTFPWLEGRAMCCSRRVSWTQSGLRGKHCRMLPPSVKMSTVSLGVFRQTLSPVHRHLDLNLHVKLNTEDQHVDRLVTNFNFRSTLSNIPTFLSQLLVPEQVDLNTVWPNYKWTV